MKETNNKLGVEGVQLQELRYEQAGFLNLCVLGVQQVCTDQVQARI